MTAGLGAGKTHGICQWHHHRVQLNRGVKFSGFVEPTYQKIHDAALPTYKKVLESFGLSEGAHYRVIKSPYPKLIYLTQPHEVHFISGENPEKIVAVEYGFASEDEAGIIPAEATRNLRSRIRDTASQTRQLMRGGAPQGINDFAKEFDSQTLPGWDLTVSRDHRLLEKRYRRFIVWTDDNPFLPPDYTQLLEDTYGHNKNLIRSYRYGEFCALVEGAAYKNYLPQKHDIDDVQPDQHRPIDLTWDFNANPLAWVAIQCFPFTEYGERRMKWVAVHEANQSSGQLDDACVEFAAKFPRALFANVPINLYGDMSGHGSSHKVRGSDYETIARLLRELGYNRVEIRAARSNPPETASVDALDNLFLRSQLYVCKRLRLLRNSLLATTWKEGTRKIDKPAGETWTHHGDAAKYWAHAVGREDPNMQKIHGKNW